MSREEEEALRWQIEAGAVRLEQGAAQRRAEALRRIADRRGGDWERRAQEAALAAEPIRIYDRLQGRYRDVAEVLDALQAGLLEKMVTRESAQEEGRPERISDEELRHLEGQAEQAPQYWTPAVARHFREGGPVTEELVADLRFLAETTGVPWRASRGGHGG